MNFSQNREDFLLRLKRELTVFNPAVVTAKFNSADGHFLQIDYTADVKLTVRRIQGGEWCLELFRERSDGSKATDFPQVSKTLLQEDPIASPSPDELADAFMKAFESLLRDQPALKDLYSDEVHSRFLELSAKHRARRTPIIEARKVSAEILEERQRKSLIGETVLATILGLGMLSFVLTFLSLF